MEKKNFYITTPIYYASGQPHIGHAYSTIAADAMARFKRLQGCDVMFLTGMDEHGQKVEQNAGKENKTPKQFVDEIAVNFKNLWKTLDISYDKFIRTTDDYHVKAVQKIFKELYDKGEEKAFVELFKTFATEKYPVEKCRIGILGMTPQDISDLAAADKIRALYQQKYGQQAVCYCMGEGLEEIKKASSASRNIVVSPAALMAAKYLEKTFGTPYEIHYPLVEELLPDLDYTGKKVLVVHQQVIADSIRKELIRKGAKTVQTAGWFMMKKELLADGDMSLRDEDDYIELVQNGDFDIIFADGCMERMTPEFKGRFINTRHFAVSGKLIGK